MEISGLPQNTQASAEMFNAAKLASAPPVKKSDAVKQPVQIPAADEALLKTADRKCLNDIKQVIDQDNFKDVFVVGDSRFTIFKDVSGQFITRFTSLRDGTVTYVPEPDILRFSGGKDSYFQVNV
jgi:hypothetical protein